MRIGYAARQQAWSQVQCWDFVVDALCLGSTRLAWHGRSSAAARRVVGGLSRGKEVAVPRCFAVQCSGLKFHRDANAKSMTNLTSPGLFSWPFQREGSVARHPHLHHQGQGLAPALSSLLRHPLCSYAVCFERRLEKCGTLEKESNNRPSVCTHTHPKLYHTAS